MQNQLLREGGEYRLEGAGVQAFAVCANVSPMLQGGRGGLTTCERSATSPLGSHHALLIYIVCPVTELLFQQTESCHAIVRPHVDLAVDDGGRAEMAGVSELIALVGRLVGVVELARQISGVVSMQHGRPTVFNRPNDAIAYAIR